MGSAVSTYDSSDILFYSNKERLLQKLKFLDPSIDSIPQTLIVSRIKWTFIDLNNDLLHSIDKIYDLSWDLSARSGSTESKNNLFQGFD
jgi:hypothetical protein